VQAPDARIKPQCGFPAPQFSALLNEIAARKPVDFLLKASDSKQFAQDETRVVEAERPIEIGSQQIVL
jgi:hypothetical protein